MRLTVCTNNETASGYYGAESDEATEQATTDVIDELVRRGYEPATESFFARWNGGPLKGPVHVEWFVGDEELMDEDDPDSWEVVEWSAIWRKGPGSVDIPESITSKVEADIYAAIAKATTTE
jgi:hypothetical protein